MTTDIKVQSQLKHLIPMSVPEFSELPTPSSAPAMAMRQGTLYFYTQLWGESAPAWHDFTTVAMRTQEFNDLITELIVNNVRDRVNTALAELDLTMSEEEFMGYLDNVTSVGGIELTDILTVNDIIDCGVLSE